MFRSSMPILALVLAAAAPRAAGDPATSPTAQYRVTFQATWSSQSHPQNFPSGPHFSGLIGGTHDGSVSFWTPGGLASPGIEMMSELGSKSPLNTEIQSAITAGQAGQIISGGGIGLSPGSVQVTFTASQQFPLVTLVSMIAPSPDWFVGVAGLQLAPDGEWVEQLVVPLAGWDAGTDDGATYLAADNEPFPHHAIALIAGGPAGNGAPFGTFTFQRIDAPPTWSDLGQGLAGAAGVPTLVGSGSLAAGGTMTVALQGGAPTAALALFAGYEIDPYPFKGGLLVPSLDLLVLGLQTDAGGALSISASMPAGVPSGTTIVVQEWIVDAGAPFGYAASNAVCGRTP